MAVEQFQVAAAEPKVSTANLMDRLYAAPLDAARQPPPAVDTAEKAPSSGRRLVMRKAMTNVLDELLEENQNVRGNRGGKGGG